MSKLSENVKRRESTSMRDNEVHRIYNSIINELGDLATVVSRGYIYERIKRETKLSIRTISFIINHIEPNGGVIFEGFICLCRCCATM